MQITYDQLVTQLENYAEENSLEFETAIPNIIALAEDRIIRDLDLSIFDVTVENAMTPGASTIGKPSDMIAYRNLFILVSGARVRLQERDESYLLDYWPTTSSTSQPKYFADESPTTFLIAPTPDSGYTYQLRYIQRPAGLSESNQSTWLSQKVGDLVFFQCLVQALGFLREDPANQKGQIALWQANYNRALDLARIELSPFIVARQQRTEWPSPQV